MEKFSGIIVNCTPHRLNVVCADGSIRTLEPSGLEPTVSEKREVIREVDEINLYATTYGKIEGLPEPQFRVYFIVSPEILLVGKNYRLDLLTFKDGCVGLEV